MEERSQLQNVTDLYVTSGWLISDGVVPDVIADCPVSDGRQRITGYVTREGDRLTNDDYFRCLNELPVIDRQTITTSGHNYFR